MVNFDHLARNIVFVSYLQMNSVDSSIHTPFHNLAVVFISLCALWACESLDANEAHRHAT